MTRGPQRMAGSRPSRLSTAWVTASRDSGRSVVCMTRDGVQEGVLGGDADRGGLVQRRDGLHGDSRMLVQEAAGTHEGLLAVPEVGA